MKGAEKYLLKKIKNLWRFSATQHIHTNTIVGHTNSTTTNSTCVSGASDTRIVVATNSTHVLLK